MHVHWLSFSQVRTLAAFQPSACSNNEVCRNPSRSTSLE